MGKWAFWADDIGSRAKEAAYFAKVFPGLTAAFDA